MQAAKIAFFTLGCLSLGTQVGAQIQTNSTRFDSHLLGGAVTSATPTQAASEQTKNRSKAIASDEKLNDEKSEKDLLMTIQSLTTVLAASAPGPMRDKVLLNRAVAANRYGRLKLINAKKYALTDEIKKYLNDSIRDADELIRNPKTSALVAAKAHEIAGTSALYLEKNDLSREHFLLELKLNPPPEMAGRIGLMIAEQDFDQAKYEEAASYYTQYFDRMTSKWKELSLYKLGWCMVNLKQTDRAKAYFLKIAHVNSPTGIGRDAIRDLAYFTSSKANSVSEVLETQTKIPALPDQIAYLNDVLVTLETMNFPVEHAQIADRLLVIEKDPVERVSILLSQIRMQKRPYASAAHMRAYGVTTEYLAKLNDQDLKAVLAKYGPSLTLESENIFKAYIDTYAGRVKVSDEAPLSPPQLIAGLKIQLRFLEKYFVASAHFPLVVELWENLCIDNKDWKGVDEITQKIMSTQPILSGLLENAYINQIAALDQLHTDSDRRAQRMNEFIDRFPKSPRWPQVVKWQAQFETATGHYENGAKMWTKVMNNAPDEQSFYQLQYCRFKLADYKTLLDDPRNQNYLKTNPDLTNLYREASLKAAEGSKQSNNDSQYRHHIEEFIRLSNDPAKARIARLDLLNNYIKKGELDEAFQRYSDLPAEEKSAKEYSAFKLDLWRSAIEKEKYGLAVLCAGGVKEQIFSKILDGGRPDATTLLNLTPADQNYFLGVYALFEPEYSLQLMRTNPRLFQRERYLLSTRLKHNQWVLDRTPEAEKYLGKDFAFAEVQAPLLKVEISIERIRFPDLSKMSPKKQARMVNENLDAVRVNRRLALKAIEKQTPSTQFRVFEKMEKLENKMAEFLMSSPIPAGLSEPQVAEYRAGLQGAASEFTEQGKQFRLLANKSGEGILKNKQQLESRILPQPDLKKWSWPSGVSSNSKLASAFRLQKNGNLLASMVLLDYLRPSELPQDENFFYTRVGTILQSNPSDSLRIYLLNELEKNKQIKIIQEWSKITNRPVPGVL